ncbi:MAG: hypothetical protein ACPIOQ_69275, partial [Promethearchaeia archaeon]
MLAGIFIEIGEVASDDPAWLVPAGDHTLRGNGFSLSIPRLSPLFIACPPRCTAWIGVPLVAFQVGWSVQNTAKRVKIMVKMGQVNNNLKGNRIAGVLQADASVGGGRERL